MTVEVINIPAKLIGGLRTWYHPKDRSVILDDDCFIEGDEITTPPNPIVGRRRLYAKNDCWYDLDSNGTETGLCVSGVDPAGHTHSKLVGFDGTPNPSLSVDADGYISAAVQPLFSAYISATVNNVTGDGTVYTIIPTVELSDRGNHYNNATGVFTAPINGNYYLNCQITVSNVGAAHVAANSAIVTSNRTYYQVNVDPIQIGYNGYAVFQITDIVDMDAGDTAYCTIAVYFGAKIVHAFGGQTYSWFSGKLEI